MRSVILAGGRGTRLQEETVARPKPLVEIGGKPILWHIMKHFNHHGFHEFCIALGYLGDYVKDYFLNCFNLSGNMKVDFASHSVERNNHDWENWVVHLIETGSETLTGGRIRKLKPWLSSETFMVTYGDGVSDVDLTALVRFHRSHGRLATVTAVRPPARFGGLILDGDQVSAFAEKPMAREGWINGGFLVFEPGVFEYLERDPCSLEGHALEQIAADGQLFAFRHDGFWQCMDTLREKDYLESLWRQNAAPWKTWSMKTGGESATKAA
jgi:glucose-1-phosphate cytidylyltransferase